VSKCASLLQCASSTLVLVDARQNKSQKPSRGYRPLIRGGLAGRELLASLAARPGATLVARAGAQAADHSSDGERAVEATVLDGADATQPVSTSLNDRSPQA
jgi:hypothetical protein